MTGTLTRPRLQQFWDDWLEANREAERVGDWAPLGDYYMESATYGWMYHPDEHFMAVGRQEIKDYALGTEMAGLEGWHYDYLATVMDEETGMVVGFWKQLSGLTDDNGEEYEILGIGGSWFGVETDPSDGRLRFAWQRDWFDLGSSAHTMLRIAADGKAPQRLLDRMSLKGIEQPGHYRLRDLPSTIWPPPVERGDNVTQRAPA